MASANSAPTSGSLRMGLPHFAHRLGVSAIQRAAVFWLRICVARAERFDQVAFDLRSTEARISWRVQAPSRPTPPPVVGRRGN